MSALRSRVVERYDAVGAVTWADPHPDGRSPRDEEYSRVTDPARYRAVHLRARVWADVLDEVVGAQRHPLPPGPVDTDAGPRWFHRGTRLEPRHPGALALLLLETDSPVEGQDGSLSVVTVSVLRPELSVAVLPDCGCDACDRGSDDLLDALDDAIARVVSGPFVVLRTDGWSAQWSPESSSSGGTRHVLGHRRAIELCERLARGDDIALPRGVEAHVGRSWLD